MEKVCKEICDDVTKLKIDMAHLETRVEQAIDIINEQKEEMKAIHTLASSVEKLAYEMSQMRHTQTDIKTKVNDLEKKPLKTYDAIKMQIILSFITAIVGFFVGKLL